MTACRNEATGGVLANVKGSNTALAEAIDYAKNPPKEWRHDCNNPRLLATQEEVDEANAIPVPLVQRIVWRVGDRCPWVRLTLTPPEP